jgi:hypothetical protein
MTSITELLKNKKQQINDKRVGAKNPYKFKGGVTTLRILPSWRDEDPTFYHAFGQSFIKNMDGKVLAVIGARNIAYGEDDAVQNLIALAKQNSSTDAQRKHWDDAKAKSRQLVNALVLDDKETDPNVAEIISLSDTMFEQIIDQVGMAGIQEEFLDLEKGFNLKVSKTGSGLNTKYSFVFERKATAVNPAVMETVTDLDAYVRSQMADTDRAINAIKSITTGNEHLSIEDRSASYSGDGVVVDGSYSAVDDDDTPPFAVDNEKEVLTDADIEGLFED